VNTRTALLALLLVLCTQPADASSPPPSRNFGAAAIYQWPAELENGGELTIIRSHLQEGGKLFASRSLMANWGLEIDMSSYDFKEQATDAWDEIYRVGVNISLIHPFNHQWSLLVVPSISATGEADAAAGESLAYGMVTALNWKPTENLSLGLGGAVFENLDETQGVPVIMIDWQLTPRWRLTNPLRSGVTGPAGLELSWHLTDNWTLGSGGTWRNLRFRLDEEGQAPGGTGEESQLPVWVRLTRQLGQTQLTLYAGAALNGSLTVEDRDGNQLASNDYDETPFLALYFSGRF